MLTVVVFAIMLPQIEEANGFSSVGRDTCN